MSEKDGMVFCRACGKEIHKTAVTCPACGAPQHSSKRYKDKTAAAVLAFFLGGLGVHRFYLGQWWGLFYLIFCWTFIPGLIAFIEFIVFLASDRQKWDDKYNEGMSSGSGGSSGVWVIVALVVAFGGIALIGILAAIALPAYQDYTERAKTAQAYALAQSASVAVTRFYTQQNRVPATLPEAGFNETLPANIGTLEINPRNAVLSVHFAGSPLAGKTLQLIPEASPQGEISWRCASEDLLARQLPPACRP